MKRRKVLFVVGIGALVVLVWAVFRPELLFVDKTVNEAFPESSTAVAATPSTGVLARGEFEGVAHEARGVASIHGTTNGKRVLRLTEFETSNGPALHVYVIAAARARDNDTVKSAGFVDLGPLKGNRGDQNYELPDDVDLARHRAVTIWCSRFGVNFATAPLAPRS